MAEVIEFGNSPIGSCPNCGTVTWCMVPKHPKLGAKISFKDIDYLECSECQLRLERDDEIIFEMENNNDVPPM